MNIEKLRYFLTEHTEKYFFTCENFHLLIHPTVSNYYDLINKIKDDIELMPNIDKTLDNTDIMFYQYDYDKKIYSKSELLSFIYASINSDWDIIKGINLLTGKHHFWLKHEDVIYDPSLSIITNEYLYSKKFKQLKVIKNEEINNYLEKNNNLYKFYNNFNSKNDSNFSIDFIKKIKKYFNNNVTSEYFLDEQRIKHIKQNIMHNDFVELRQVLTEKRKSYLNSSTIAVHPSIDDSILEVIEKNAQNINKLMKEEYNISFNYYNYTIGNCYALSILFNLFDEDFKLVQGYIPYQRFNNPQIKHYQHSWLEKDDIVYDPSLRIVTPKELYYIFSEKQDIYSQKETIKILMKIGFNLTHFKDFLNGIQIGNDDSIRYKCRVYEVGSDKMKEEGGRLVKTLKKV